MLTDAKANSVPAFLDNLERNMSSETFRMIFITLTCDGGRDFIDIEGIERRYIYRMLRNGCTLLTRMQTIAGYQL